MGLNGAQKGQAGSNRTKRGQTVQIGPNRAKWGRTGSNRAKREFVCLFVCLFVNLWVIELKTACVLEVVFVNNGVGGTKVEQALAE